MKTILLAAGYGTRLYPLTKNKPKPLLEVAGKPIIEHIIDKIVEITDIDRIYIVTNQKFTSNFEEWLKNSKSKISIEIINDKTTSNEDRLGAVGDINFVIETKQLNDDILVVAGDNLFKLSLIDLNNFFKEKNKTIIALYDVKDRELAKKYGIVAIDENNKVTEFHEKPIEPKSTLASTGIYIFPKKTINLIKGYINEGNSPDKTGEFLEWLFKKEEVSGFVSKEPWYDIGGFEQLEEARKEFKK